MMLLPNPVSTDVLNGLYFNELNADKRESASNEPKSFSEIEFGSGDKNKTEQTPGVAGDHDTRRTTFDAPAREVTKQVGCTPIGAAEQEPNIWDKCLSAGKTIVSYAVPVAILAVGLATANPYLIGSGAVGCVHAVTYTYSHWDKLTEHKFGFDGTSTSIFGKEYWSGQALAYIGGATAVVSPLLGGVIACSSIMSDSFYRDKVFDVVEKGVSKLGNIFRPFFIFIVMILALVIGRLVKRTSYANANTSATIPNRIGNAGRRLIKRFRIK